MQISNKHYVVTVVQEKSGDVIVGAYDTRTCVNMEHRIAADKVAKAGIPPSLLATPNPASPPMPDAWSTLAARLSVNTATPTPTLVFS